MFQGQITCRICNERFSAMEWLQNDKCCEPNCRCPKVQEQVMRARQVINNAKAGPAPGTNLVTEVTRGPVPHGYIEGREDQVWIKVPDVKVITIKPGKK